MVIYVDVNNLKAGLIPTNYETYKNYTYNGT